MGFTIAAKYITKILFKKTRFGTNNCVKITKQSLYKANSFACSLANRDKPVAATLQRKCSGGVNCTIIAQIITKIIVPMNYFVIISARMVRGSQKGSQKGFLDEGGSRNCSKKSPFGENDPLCVCSAAVHSTSVVYKTLCSKTPNCKLGQHCVGYGLNSVEPKGTVRTALLS